MTEHIVEEVGDEFYSIKVDGTRDPTGRENISIVLRFIDAHTSEIRERLLTIATAEEGDAKTLTQTVISELTKAGLSTDKILSQVYDGASVMSGKHGGVQKLLQEELKREIPYVHCFNHQLHLVVVQAMSAEQPVIDFFSVCNLLYKFIRRPTVAVHYKGETLKRLLDQRWTGHLATVQVISKAHENISQLLTELDTHLFPADVRVEAVGLLRAISKPSFRFIALLMSKILTLFEAPNRLLQSKDMDLHTAVQLVNAATKCIEGLRTETEFSTLWDQCAEPEDNPQSKRRRTETNTRLQDFVVEQSVGARIDQENTAKQQRLRLYYGCIDAVCGEMARRFGERNSALIESLASLDPESDTFLDAEKVRPLLDLTGTKLIDAEFVVARQFLRTQMEGSTRAEDENWTVKTLFTTFHKTLEAMPSVMVAFKSALTFGASTATCENSFSVITGGVCCIHGRPTSSSSVLRRT